MLYEIVVKSADSLGLSMLDDIVHYAADGAVIKSGTIPRLTFPHVVTMEVEADKAPTPKPPHVRVFEAESRKEIHLAFVEKEASGFSLDAEKVDTSLNNGKPWTKDELEAMDWEGEFKQVMADAGITGKQRTKMVRDYLAKFK